MDSVSKDDSPEAKLSRIIKSIKNPSARQATAIFGLTGQPFRQDESYDHWVRGLEESEKIVQYIEENPVAGGIGGESRGLALVKRVRYIGTTGREACPTSEFAYVNSVGASPRAWHPD